MNRSIQVLLAIIVLAMGVGSVYAADDARSKSSVLVELDLPDGTLVSSSPRASFKSMSVIDNPFSMPGCRLLRDLRIVYPSGAKSTHEIYTEDGRTTRLALTDPANTPELIVQTANIFSSCEVLVAPESDFVVIGRGGKAADLRCLKTGRILRRFSDVAGPMAISPDGKTLLAPTCDGQLTFRELHSDRTYRTLDRMPEIKLIKFNSDGSLFATVDSRHVVTLWDFENGRIIQTLEGVNQALTEWHNN